MGIKDIAIKKLGKDFPKSYIKLKIKDKRLASQTIQGYEIIRKKNLFDDEFYRNKYPKLKNSDLDLLLHYIFFGFDEGKSPNKDFDGVFYKNHYPDVAISKLNPLVHYALYGLAENRQISVGKVDLSNYFTGKRNILYISHEKIGTLGGASFSNLDIIKNISDEFHGFILTSNSGEVELWSFNHSLEKIADWKININSLTTELTPIYDEILSKLDISIVHINHLINHSFNLINLINKKNIPYLINIHDFYYICPSIHLIDADYNYCHLDCKNCSSKLIKENKFDESFINSWRENSFNLLNNAYKIIVPSNSAINLYKEVFNDLNNFELIEHGRNLTKLENKYTLPDEKIKVLIPGHISPHKGSYLIKSLKEFDKDNRLEIHFIGTQIPNLKKYGTTHGRYLREEFNCLISKIKPSYIAILSTCPETYSYTLTESWASGIPVIASDLGALKERIISTGGGWLVDYTSASNIYNSILNISKEDYLKKISNISKIKFKTTDEMILEYNTIYKEILLNE